MLTTLMAMAAVDPATAETAAQTIAGTAAGMALGASGGAAWLARQGDRVRRAGHRESVRLAARGASADRLYLTLIQGAERRSNRAFMASLVAGIGGAAAILGGAAAGLLFGMPDVGIFTAITGAVPGSISILLGRASTNANRDVKEYFQQLAESREKDREVDRVIRLRAAEGDAGSDPTELGADAERHGIEARSLLADDLERGHPWNADGELDEPIDKRGNVYHYYFDGPASGRRKDEDDDEDIARDR